MNVLERTPPEPSRVERYADGETGLVDVFDPPGAPRGTVILLHGGFWRASYDRRHLRHLAAALAADGLRVALPEYRRVGDTGGGMPGTVDDAHRIVREVPALLDATAGDVVLGGHSAGAHLAVLAALGAEEPPRRVVGLAGVLDLAAAHRTRLSHGAVAELLGEESPAPAMVATIDPMALSVPACELVLVHGRADDVVPVSYSASYGRRDERIRIHLLDDADHFDVVDPVSLVYPVIAEALGACRPSSHPVVTGSRR